jgi:SM-20-related protein
VTTTTPYLQLFDFLEADEVQQLLDAVTSTLDTFDPSTVYLGPDIGGHLDEDARRSKVRMDTSELLPLFERRLLSLLPHVRRAIGLDRFDLGWIEAQLTVHGDGDFFTRHRDENNPGTDGARALTYVYYFHAEPKEFEGGQLRLSVPSADGGLEQIEIEPEPNSIVFFPADFEHEVLPIRTTGDGPGSLRCTFNGWYRIGKGTGAPLPRLSRVTLCEVQRAFVPRVCSRGFSLRPTPATVHRRLAVLWAHQRGEARPEGPDPEYFPNGSPSYLSIGPLGNELLEELRPMHEAWAGVPLVATAAYGIRNYERGQTAPTHVDRCESHIITTEIVIDQATDEPWPLRLRIDGTTHEVQPEAGHMVTYEGASCPAGRPRPLQGSYATLLLHYRPVDWALNLGEVVQAAQRSGCLSATGELVDAMPIPVIR